MIINQGRLPFNSNSIRFDGDGVWENYYRRCKAVMDSLGFDPDATDQLKTRTDAGEAYFLEHQLRYVMTERLKEDRAPNKAELFIPIDSSMPRGAESWVYRVYRAAGTAKVITDYADDLPPVDVVQSEVTGKVISIGNSFSYSIDDLQRAAYSGQPLERDKMDAAADEVDRAMDEIASFGHVANNLPGFLNNAAVPVIVLPTGNWPTATPKQILADLRFMEETILQGVYHQPGLSPDTLLLDTVSWQITRQEVTDFTEKSTLQRFLDTSTTVKNADVWHKLDTADAVGTGPRIVMYRRDPSILRMIVPQTFEMLPPQPKNLALVVPTHAKIGGVDVRKPYTMAYSDSVD
jgi:hypothetical protein